MAFYNPSQDAQDRYYDPQSNVQQDTGAELGNNLKLMATAMALNAVGAVVTHKLIGGVKSTLRSWEKNTASVIRRDFAKGVIDRYSSVKNNFIKPINDSLQRTGAWKAAEARKVMLKTKEGMPGYGALRLISGFKDFNTFAGTLGGVWKKNVLAGLPLAYGIDSLLGFTRDMGLEKKKIYDIPGQVTNFAKWAAYQHVGGFAFGGGGAVLGAMGSYGFKALQKTFQGQFGDLVLKNASKFGRDPLDKRLTHYGDHLVRPVLSEHERTFLTSSTQKGLHFGKNLAEAHRFLGGEIKTSVHDIFQKDHGSYVSRTQKAFKSVGGALKESWNILRKRSNFSTSDNRYGGLSFLSVVSAHAQEIGKQFSAERKPGHTPIPLGGEKIKEFFNQAVKDQETSGGVIPKLFGKKLKQVYNKDVWDASFVSDLRENLSKKYVAGDVDQLIEGLGNLKTGRNIYRVWNGNKMQGGMVDLGFLDPVHMMKRAIQPIMHWQFPIPGFSQLSLAKLTNTEQWITDKPDVFATRHEPGFRLLKPEIGKTTVGSLSNDPHNSLYLHTNSGKWAIFDNGAVKIAETGRSLGFAHKSSANKLKELEESTLDQIRAQRNAGNLREANALAEAADHGRVVNNEYVGFLDHYGIEFPKAIKNYWKKLRGKYDGRDGYKLEYSSFYAGQPDKAIEAAALMENVYGYAGHTLARVSTKPEAQRVMANYIKHTGLQNDFLGAMRDNQELVNQISFREARLSKDKDFVTSIHNVKAFPEQAFRHDVTQPLGGFSAMTDMAKVRVSYIEDVFNQQRIGGGNPHEPNPLMNIADDLFNNGIINHSEKKNLLLFAKLSSFRENDKSLITGLHHADRDEFDRVRGMIKNHCDENKWDLMSELIDFSANNKVPRPSIMSSQERIIGEHLKHVSDVHPFVSRPNKVINAFGEWAEHTLDRSVDMIGEWSPFKKFRYSNSGVAGNAKYVGRMIGFTAAAFMAGRILDTATAATPIFDDTMFEDGLVGAAADVVAKARFGMAKVADFTGVTSTMKYLHGFAPYSEGALPGAFVGSALGIFAKLNPIGIAGMAIGGAFANRIASPYLPDLTKSEKELKEIYAGRKQVPIMKAPTWLLGGTPWEGSGVTGFSPNWYVRAKSRWKETDTVYGSAFRKLIHEPLPLLGFNIGDLVDPYYMERKNYFTRPYPLTGGAFDEVPLVGKALSATIGRIIKPVKTMHQDFLTKKFDLGTGDVGDPYGFGIRPPTVLEGQNYMNPIIGSPGSTLTSKAANYGKVNLLTNKYWSETASEDFLYDVQAFAGLKGFLGGTAAQKIFGKAPVVPSLESAGRIASMSRSFYDLNIGGAGVLTEPLRRIMEKPLYKQYGVNPIANRMPNWLPQQFLNGDPYAKILRGELRLPGDAYLSTHTDINRDMPARASMIGGTLENIVQYFTGLIPPGMADEYDTMEEGTAFHRSIQETLATEGMLIQAEVMVQDVKNDITGHVDAIIRDGNGGMGRRALEIKTINDKSFRNLDAPKNEHYSQLNFYLKQLRMNQGTLLYVNRDNPSQVKTFNIHFSQNKWIKDVKKLQKARQISGTMMSEGIGDTLGYSYSWADRMRILADVAPNSMEYKEAKQIVEKQIKFGELNKDEIEKYDNALKMKQVRIRSYELYPNRFKGKILHPDNVADIQSIDEDIKAGSEYSLPERIIGSLWESFTNTNTFLVNKFFAAKDPLEHYKMTRLYGKEYKPWDEPIRGWVDPYMRSMASKTDPIHGAMSFGLGGYILGGGPVGALIGGTAGVVYGTLNGLYRGFTDSTYIPDSIQEKREIVSYFDAAKYERNDMLASLSTGLTQQDYLAQKNATLKAFNEGGPGATVANLFRATPTIEKPYIESWLNTRDPKQRAEIIRYIPKDLGQALEKQWNTNDSKDETLSYVQQSSMALTQGAPRYQFNKSVMDPRIPLEDIELKTIESHGFDVHEFGLGWNEQMVRLQGANNQIQAANIEKYSPTPGNGNEVNAGNIRGIINNLFARENVPVSTRVFLDETLDNNILEVMVRRDRSKSIINALSNREKYGLQ